ncbi:hypothetical protein GOV13_04930 [Candidatus Pacearchaeota archaeon]|nr:hypothetical protein [Candidatus Pacearchaeota archaeon]
MKNKSIPKRVWLLLFALGVYVYILIFNQKLFLSSSKLFLNNILKIIPALILVFIIMALANYFITPKKVLRFSKKKGASKWLFMSLAGILLTGPSYLWYPLLSDLKKQGLSNGLIATYLYNRAIVIAFLPLLIFYFSLKYAIVFYIVITISALVQGLIMDQIL